MCPQRISFRRKVARSMEVHMPVRHTHADVTPLWAERIGNATHEWECVTDDVDRQRGDPPIHLESISFFASCDVKDRS
eukprot:9107-Eustigmatos_ZCMA.PRE.1